MLTVDFLCDTPALHGRRRIGAEEDSRVIRLAEDGSRTHVAGRKARAVTDSEAHRIALAGAVQAGQLLIRAGKGRAVQEEAPLVLPFIREEEGIFDRRAFKAAVDQAEPPRDAIRAFPLAPLIQIGKRMGELRIM